MLGGFGLGILGCGVVLGEFVLGILGRRSDCGRLVHKLGVPAVRGRVYVVQLMRAGTGRAAGVDVSEASEVVRYFKVQIFEFKYFQKVRVALSKIFVLLQKNLNL